MSTIPAQASAPLDRKSRQRRLSLALFVVSVTLLVFGPVVWHEFLRWDDDQALSENPDFLPPQGQLLGRLWLHPAHGYNGFYVPVTYTVWWTVAHFAHAPAATGQKVTLDPAAFHALNLSFHCGCALVVFLILRRLVLSDLPAAAGALLFAIHPLQAEPVSWVATMYTPLSGFLALLALWLYLIFSETRDNVTVQRKRIAWLWFALATLSFALGLLTKPTIVVLPVIAGVIEIVLRRKSWRRCAPLLLWLAIGAVDAIITRQNHDGEFAYRPSVWLRPIVASDALAFYWAKLLAPFHLVTDYGRTPQWLLSHRLVWLTGLLPAALLAVAWAARRRLPWLAAGILVVMIAPLATLGLLPFNFQLFSTVADRYAYLAVFGAAMLLAFFVEWAGERQWRIFFPATLALLVALGILSRVQISYWRDTPTLFAHNLEVNPTSLAAERIMGDLLVIVGTPEAHREGLGYYRAALRDHPDDPVVHEALGREMFLAHNYREAASLYGEASRLAPRIASLAYWQGRSLTALREREGAILAFSRAAAIEPDFADARLRLADLLVDAGRNREAVTYYRAILQDHPDASFVHERLRRLNAQAGVDVR